MAKFYMNKKFNSFFRFQILTSPAKVRLSSWQNWDEDAGTGRIGKNQVAIKTQSRCQKGWP